MKKLSSETEELIKDAVRKIFFEEGRLFATTTEIADTAGISRASIHYYYYRSRRKLFEQVILEESMEMRYKLNAVYQKDLSFRKRTECFIDY